MSQKPQDQALQSVTQEQPAEGDFLTSSAELIPLPKGLPGQLQTRYPTTDEHALRVVLQSLSGLSDNTIKSYRKEFLRFLLWLKTTREIQPDMLRRVTTEDLQEYANYLSNPRPLSKEFLALHGWSYSPFKKPLSSSSIAYALRLISLLFSRLQNLESEAEMPYTKFNPALNLAAGLKRQKVNSVKVRRAFDDLQWQAILQTIEEMPCETEKQLGLYHRARWVFAFMYHTFARIGDVASFKMSSFHRNEDGWFINLIGKGNTDADLIVTPDLMNELRVYRRSISLPPTPVFGEDIPGVVAFRKRAGRIYSGLTVKSIYLLCKEIFHRSALRIEQVDPEAAAKFCLATPHWLRHTSITHAMESGVQPRYVQRQARHTSLNTTARYDHADTKAWRKEFEQKFTKK